MRNTTGMPIHLALLNRDGNELPASIPATSPSAQIEAQLIETDMSNSFLCIGLEKLTGIIPQLTYPRNSPISLALMVPWLRPI